MGWTALLTRDLIGVRARKHIDDFRVKLLIALGVVFRWSLLAGIAYYCGSTIPKVSDIPIAQLTLGMLGEGAIKSAGMIGCLMWAVNSGRVSYRAWGIAAIPTVIIALIVYVNFFDTGPVHKIGETQVYQEHTYTYDGKQWVLTRSAPPGSGLGDKDTLPHDAKAKLKEGIDTTFANGQVWPLRNGQAVQVQ